MPIINVLLCQRSVWCGKHACVVGAKELIAASLFSCAHAKNFLSTAADHGLSW